MTQTQTYDPRFIVQRYAQLKNAAIHESFDNDSRVYSITLDEGEGASPLTVSVQTETTKQDAKLTACIKLLEICPRIKIVGTSVRKSIREIYESKPGTDYVEYSRQTVLKNCNIHFNNTAFFKMNHDVVSFDSEGRPLRLAQFCCNMTDVYLFDLPKYYDDVVQILTDPHIKKIVCDLRSEESSLGIVIQNYIDIQGTNQRSLTSLIEVVDQVQLKKNRMIHVIGWNHTLTKNQVDYAAADALWTFHCGLRLAHESSECK
jgi:hypothetical protein